MNFFEQITSVLVVSLVAGIEKPRNTLFALSAYVLGRVLFTVGYWKMGPNARVPGALIMDFAMLALLILSSMSTYNLATA